MNTKNLKAYAPKARSQFIEAIKKRAAQFGIYQDKIAEVQFEGGAAIIEGRAFTKKQGEQRKRLERKVTERASATYQEKYDMFIREMAYTWFNRLAAIRYMELHGYFDHGFRVISHPASTDSLPEILSHASDVADGLKLDKSHIIELQLAGDKEEQLYRELLLGQCHQLANIMPFVFKGLTADSIDDAAELLLPDNLTKTDSILKGLITDIPEEDWNDIEVIGWLYQFYISEHKDAVIGKVVKSEDIPAATQLFTPNWIVKYLVQNSLGRQWLATYPDSELKGKMEYYIDPAEQSDEVIEQLKAITPTSIDPEEIKVLDPAAGSGHILVEVYEVLREIYLERGYRLREIPELILTKNIYGLDIDDRAAQLAGFALMMKAREDDRRIFQRVEEGKVSLNVFSLQSTEHLDISKLWKALDLEGNQKTGTTGGLFDTSEEFVQPIGVYKEYFELLQYLKSSFLLAKTLGSLIQIEHQKLEVILAFKTELENKIQRSDPAAKQASLAILPIVEQSIYLSQKYDAVIANPPYMGNNGMNGILKDFAKLGFPNSKSDLFAVFIERGFQWLKKSGYNAMVTMQSWMFLSSFENMRDSIIAEYTIENMVHMGNGVMKIAFGTNAAIFRNVKSLNYKGFYSYCDNSDINNAGIPKIFPIPNSRLKTASSLDFNKIPGKPIAYWIDNKVRDVFQIDKKISDFAYSDGKNVTGNNDLFLRQQWEVSDLKTGLDKKWLLMAKGGEYRKWYGNNEFVIDWSEKARQHYRESKVGRLIPEYLWYKKGITWSKISSYQASFRELPELCTFDEVNLTFNDDTKIRAILTFLNSNVATYLLDIVNPSSSVQSINVLGLPILIDEILSNQIITEKSQKLKSAYIDSWNLLELSKGFKKNKLLQYDGNSLKDVFRVFEGNCREETLVLKEAEELINSELIKLYKLENIVSSSIPMRQVTFSGNPHYLYTSIKDEKVLFARYQSETISSLLMYVLGCAIGRYSLDRDGVVYAQSNNKGFNEFVAEGAYKTFPADDGIVPLAYEDWLFDDDATARFKEFVKTVWGNANLDENLEFVAESLCLHALKPVKGESANDTVRRYFSKQFYKDHCKTYKKRPIYWLFSSGKEKAFECLVYLHRYNEGTLSRMRTEYVTPLMGKFDAQHTLLSEQQIQATGTEARRIEKELKTLDKKQAELRTFDEQLKHYAEKRITLDLDDGVKANYGKFGNLLADVKAIHGKAVK